MFIVFNYNRRYNASSRSIADADVDDDIYDSDEDEEEVNVTIYTASKDTVDFLSSKYLFTH